jgi:hypothetical protein
MSRVTRTYQRPEYGGPVIERWVCPRCPCEFFLDTSYEHDQREPFEQQLHRHLASHFTLAQLETMPTPAPECGGLTVLGRCCNRGPNHSGPCGRWAP